MPTEQKYVYDGTEVVKTGRTAKKPSTLDKTKTLILFEVEPADKESLSWKKWVKEEDLYIIGD